MQTTNNNWINQELETMKPQTEFIRLPALKLEENKPEEFELVIDKAWDKWEDPKNGSVKKLITVKHNGEMKVFFLNVANPVYRELLLLAQDGKMKVKLMRTGQAKATRYILLK